jgi:hypothetical protein
VNSLVTSEHTVDVRRVRDALDLDRRLASTPAAAQIRGFIFKMTADEVARHGSAAVAAYRRLSPGRSRWFFRMYSLRDYLEDAGAAAAAINPIDPLSVVRRIWATMPNYAPLFNARRFLALLSASPLEVMRWVEGQRDMFYGYGGWRLERRDERYFVMHYFDEYVWLDAAHRGGLEGVLYACNVTGTVDPDLDSPFNGRIHVRWQAR